jgi:hypothetical protein
MREPFDTIRTLLPPFVLLPIAIKSTERDQISHHHWYVFDIGQCACHPIMYPDLNGANTHNVTRSIISHTHKISSLHKLIRTKPVISFLLVLQLPTVVNVVIIFLQYCKTCCLVPWSLSDLYRSCSYLWCCWWWCFFALSCNLLCFCL